MGQVYTDIELSNPRRAELAPMRTQALADTGAVTLCIPQQVAAQLSLEVESTRNIVLADGSKASVPYVGPLKVWFGQRFCYAGALVLGDEVLLGSGAMDDMDLVVNPKMRTVTVDPASPDVPCLRA